MFLCLFIFLFIFFFGLFIICFQSPFLYRVNADIDAWGRHHYFIPLRSQDPLAFKGPATVSARITKAVQALVVAPPSTQVMYIALWSELNGAMKCLSVFPPLFFSFSIIYFEFTNVTTFVLSLHSP